MAEYIEREKRYIEVSNLPNFEVTCSNDKRYILLPFEHLYDIPTADVVEVVRCKDCNYYEMPDEDDALGVCKCGYIAISCSGEIYPRPTDYCSYGERRCEE